MTYLLGIDFGGGASKATLLDGTGKIVAESTVEYPTLYTEDGGCEQSPSDWEAALLRNTGEILQKSGVNPRDIVGVALDSATHTFLLADESFRPLSRAIHWTDTRSRAEADAICEAQGCGVPLIATAHASSVRELLGRSGMGTLHKSGCFSAYIGIRRSGEFGLSYDICKREDADRAFL